MSVELLPLAELVEPVLPLAEPFALDPVWSLGLALLELELD